MTWAGKRQLIILGIILGIIVILGLIVIVPRLQKEPTCFDGRKNGDETGVDCGGSCPTFCPLEVTDLTVLWSRAFQVAPNLYNAVAYIENQNVEGAVFSIPYEFKLYDNNNVFIAGRTGKAFIEPNKNSAIFEAGIDVGNRIPRRAEFRFLGSPTWTRVNRELMNTLSVVVQERTLSGVGSSPKLTATIVNDSLYDIPDLDVITILYNDEGNAIASSKTYISLLSKKTSQEIFFTWPSAFKDAVFKIEIIPRINIFSIRF